MKLKNWAGPVALAVLVAAIVGGAVWATRGGSGTPAAGPPRMLHLSSAGAQAGTLAAGADTAKPDIAEPVGGGSQFELVGTLPDGQPDDQAVWRLPHPGADDAASVADALGLSGSPQRVDGGWVLRAGDNRLVVRDDGGWSYGMDCAPDTPVSSEDVTVGCAVASAGGVAVAAPPPDAGNTATDDGSGASPGCDPAVDECGDQPPAPDASPVPAPTFSPGPADDAARADAAPVLRALGIGDADVSVFTGSPITSVQASPRVDGMATSGWFTSLQFDGDDHLVSADGWLSGVTKGASYPVVTAHAAFDLLKDQPRPMTEMCMRRTDGKPGCAPIPPTQITGAELGLSLDYDAQRPVLVPAWLFAVKGQDEPLAQVAVDPAYLAPPPTAGPGSIDGSTEPVPPNESTPVEVKPMPAESAPASHP